MKRGLDLRPVDVRSAEMHHGNVMSVSLRRSRVFPLLMWLLAFGTVIAAVFVWWTFARALHSATPVPAADVPTPDAVVWHGKVYRSRTQLAHDLRRSGRTYYVWARNHPGAATLLAELDRSQTHRSGVAR